jgi:geranylgeranyl reductase family protein
VTDSAPRASTSAATGGSAAPGVEADVIVVGAGPAGSTAAYHLAQAGLDVVVLEKTAFPREKVCGDGLTPRATRQLVRMGVDISPEAGWLRNRGLRILGGGHRLELDWPDLAAFPGYGLVRRRIDFDELLARQAVKAGAQLHERTPVTGALRDERTGRVLGVLAKPVDGAEVAFRAPVVLAADGNSSRLSLSVGRNRRADRPMGVAVRTYYTSPQHQDDYLESWLELWDRTDPADPKLLPGYGWIFGMGDGTCNVGLGILNTSARSSTSTTRSCSAAGSTGRPRARFREPPPGRRPRRRPADGLQPPAALHRRADARRRRWGDGQPLQR